MNNKFFNSKEFKEIIDSGNSDFLLVDIREKNEFDDWKIEGSVNVPVNDFIAVGDVQKIQENLLQLPRNKRIVMVCMRGINSQLAASILNEQGYDAYFLRDGLKGWNRVFEIHEINFDYVFTIAQFIRIGKGCLSYILYSDIDKEAIVFDPSVVNEEYIDYINGKGLKVKYVVDTHTHADHFSGGIALAKKLGVEYIVKNEKLNKGKIASPESYKLDLPNVNISIFKTPGHTDDSLSYLINERALLCGDLLLLESPGRPDLARDKKQTIEGAEKLFDTLNNIILKLNKNVKILPGHIMNTPLRPAMMTLEELKAQNDSLILKGKDEFVKFITANIPDTPPNFETIKKYNLAGKYIPVDYAEDLEIGPNRCGSRK